MMDHNNPLQNYNGYSQPPQTPQMEQPLNEILFTNTSYSYTDYFPATDNNTISASYTINNYEQSPAFSFVNNASTTPTTQSASQNIPHSSSSESLNTAIANNSYHFEIPGFKIIIIPTTTTTPYANLNNSNTQNQFQQDNVPLNIVTNNSQIQFQQNSNESFINFNNFRG